MNNNGPEQRQRRPTSTRMLDARLEAVIEEFDRQLHRMDDEVGKMRVEYVTRAEADGDAELAAERHRELRHDLVMVAGAVHFHLFMGFWDRLLWLLTGRVKSVRIASPSEREYPTDDRVHTEAGEP